MGHLGRRTQWAFLEFTEVAGSSFCVRGGSLQNLQPMRTEAHQREVDVLMEIPAVEAKNLQKCSHFCGDAAYWF